MSFPLFVLPSTCIRHPLIMYGTMEGTGEATVHSRQPGYSIYMPIHSITSTKSEV